MSDKYIYLVFVTTISEVDYEDQSVQLQIIFETERAKADTYVKTYLKNDRCYFEKLRDNQKDSTGC